MKSKQSILLPVALFLLALCTIAWPSEGPGVGDVVRVGDHFYTLVLKMGSGSYGGVFRARREDGTQFALKIEHSIHAHRLRATRLVQTRIDDPAVVKVFDVGAGTVVAPEELETWLVTVMEIVQGITLDEFIAVFNESPGGTLEGIDLGRVYLFRTLTAVQRERLITFALNTMQQAVRFLRTMESADLVHNDLSGNNLMLVTELSIRELIIAIRDGEISSLPLQVIDYGSVRKRDERRIEGMSIRAFKCDGVCKPEKDLLDLAGTAVHWVRRLIPLRRGESYFEDWEGSSAERYLKARPHFHSFERFLALGLEMGECAGLLANAGIVARKLLQP